MSRPPSARPKTSAGQRAPSRNQRPSISIHDNQSITMNRPVSRNALSRAGVEPPRTSIGSRSGFGPPPTAAIRFNSSIQLEMGERSRMGARPPTGMAITNNVPFRPITQQGLRAPTRAGTASGNRQVLDKNYFIGLLRVKANELNAEINRLNKEMEKGERARIELVAYEKKADENARIITMLRGMLSDYNTVLDKMHTSSDLGGIEMDALEWKRKADEVASIVEESFTERKEKEDEMARLEEGIVNQKKKNHQIISSMDPTLKDRYEALKEQSEALKELVIERQNELGDLQNMKNELETDLFNSPLKQKAANLRENLVEMATKERELMEERSNEESLDQKKAKLIDSVRKNNEEIAAMEKQMEQINEQIENAQEELHEFNADVEMDNKKQMESYKSLQNRESDIITFLSGYEEEKRMETMIMEEHQDGIVKNLKRISVNLAKVNMSMNVNDMDPSVLEMDEGASPDELKQLHIRLEEELITLNEMETRINAELEAFERRGEDMKDELDRLADYDRLVAASQDENTNLEKRRDELVSILPHIEEELNENEGDMDEVTQYLRGDDTIAYAENLRKKLEYLEETNNAMKEQAAAIQSERDYQDIKNKVLALQIEYNKLLLRDANQRR